MHGEWSDDHIFWMLGSYFIKWPLPAVLLANKVFPISDCSTEFLSTEGPELQMAGAYESCIHSVGGLIGKYYISIPGVLPEANIFLFSFFSLLKSHKIFSSSFSEFSIVLKIL